MIKIGISAFILSSTLFVSIPIEAAAAGENIPLTSNHQVSLTSDVDRKVVQRGNITITVGNMLGTPNTVECSRSSNADTCNYSLGLTLIKTPEKFSYDLEKNYSSCILYDTNPTHIKDWCNTYSLYGKANQSFGGVKADIQFIGKKSNLQSSNYLQLTFSTVGWPGGEYTFMAFSNAASYGAAKSNPLNFTLTEIPKTNIESTSPQSTYSGTAFSVSCTSTLSLASIPVNVTVAGSTSKVVLGEAIANGIKFEIPNVKIESVGVTKVQVSIPAIIDTLQPSTSNVMAIQVAAPRANPIRVKCSGPATADAKSTLTFKCEANQKISSTGSELISIRYKSSNGLWTWFDDVWDLDDLSSWKTKTYFRFNALNEFGKDFAYNGSKVQFFRWEQSKEGSDTETLWVSNIIKVSVKGKGSSSSAPQGTINRKSNSYKLMYNFGKNLARVSTPSDSAKSQCTSAKNSGFIKQNGRKNHLGSEYSFIQSHLRTASGYQGCIDGFNSL